MSTTTAAAPVPAPSAPVPLLRRTWVHALLLGFTLIAVLPAIDNGTPALVDEGVYSAQAANLARGDWAAPRPLAHLDDEGARAALIDVAVVGDEWIPYSRQPLYPLVLTPWYRLGGYRGMLVFSILGTWIASVASAGIARLFDRRFSIPALWITGLGSPLLFDSYVVLAHSTAAAASGLLGYGLLRAWGFGDDGSTSGPDLRWLMCAVPSAVALILLRSEGAVVVASVAVVSLLLSVSGHLRSLRLDRRRALSAVAVGAVGAVTYLANAIWGSAIAGRSVGAAIAAGRDTDPLAQTWVSILRPWGIDNRFASAALTLMVVGSIAAPLCLRFLPARPILAVGLLCLAAVGSLAHHLERQELVSGLIATIPIVVMGLLLLPRAQLRVTPMKFLLATSALGSIVVIWTSYGVGGTAEWGGRYYHVLLPFLVPAATVGLGWGLATLPARLRVVAVVATAAMTASLCLAALRTLSDYRTFNRSEVDAVLQVHKDRGGKEPVIFATFKPSGLTRLFWRELVDGAPILNGGSIGSFNAMLPTLADGDIDRVTVITDVDLLTFEYVLGKARGLNPTDTSDWKLTTAPIPLDGTGLTALQMQRGG